MASSQLKFFEKIVKLPDGQVRHDRSYNRHFPTISSTRELKDVTAGDYESTKLEVPTIIKK